MAFDTLMRNVRALACKSPAGREGWLNYCRVAEPTAPETAETSALSTWKRTPGTQPVGSVKQEPTASVDPLPLPAPTHAHR